MSSTGIFVLWYDDEDDDDDDEYYKLQYSNDCSNYP